MSKGEEIEDVRGEEQRRSKRPIDIAARKRRLLLRKKFMDALQSANEAQFREALIRDLDQSPGSPAFENSMRAWREYHGKRRN